MWWEIKYQILQGHLYSDQSKKRWTNLEILRIEIPQIQIKEIYIPRTRTWEQYRTTLDIIDNMLIVTPPKKDKELVETETKQQDSVLDFNDLDIDYLDEDFLDSEEELEFTELDINFLDVNFLEDLLNIVDALAIAEFIKTPSHPISNAIAASEAHPIPASTITGILDWSFIIFIFCLFGIPFPDPINDPKGITETTPKSSSCLQAIGSSEQ